MRLEAGRTELGANPNYLVFRRRLGFFVIVENMD